MWISESKMERVSFLILDIYYKVTKIVFRLTRPWFCFSSERALSKYILGEVNKLYVIISLASYF